MSEKRGPVGHRRARRGSRFATAGYCAESEQTPLPVQVDVQHPGHLGRRVAIENHSKDVGRDELGRTLAIDEPQRGKGSMWVAFVREKRSVAIEDLLKVALLVREPVRGVCRWLRVAE